MGDPTSDEERKALVDRLMQKAYEQHRQSPERSPFWREGPFRCEFYTQPAERLKLFSGDRCVYEEAVQGTAGANRRSEELHRDVARGQVPRGGR
jgi:hypothetical protein